MFVKFDHIKGR